MIKRIIPNIFVILFFLLSCISLYPQTLDAPESIAAVLLVKLSAFEKTVASSGNVFVYVLGAPKVAVELEKGIGETIGQSRLTRVVSGDDLPNEKPTILYVGNISKLSQAIAYSRIHKILSVTGKPDLVKKGVTLGIGVGNDGKPKVILNLHSTVEENLTWNPAIMKVARTLK